MNTEQIAPLLEKLANKLGTTADHLWGVMIVQARIDGYVTLAQIAIMVVATFFYVKGLKYFLKNAEEMHEGAFAASVICVVIGAIIGIIVWLTTFFNLNLLIASFFNPEYYALHEIMQALKSK
jgi:ABC-type proline/glycine betaine transport system permease subunit